MNTKSTQGLYQVVRKGSRTPKSNAPKMSLLTVTLKMDSYNATTASTPPLALQPSLVATPPNLPMSNKVSDRAARKNAKKAAKTVRVDKNKARQTQGTPADPAAWHDYPSPSEDDPNPKVASEDPTEKIEYSEQEEDEIVFDIAARKYLKLKVVPSFDPLRERRIHDLHSNALFVFDDLQDQKGEQVSNEKIEAGAMALAIAEELNMEVIEALPELTSGIPEDVLGFISNHALIVKMLICKGLVRRIMHKSPIVSSLVEISEEGLEMFQALGTIFGSMNSFEEVCQGETLDDEQKRKGTDYQIDWLSI